jgi:hypothetical protein
MQTKIYDTMTQWHVFINNITLSTLALNLLNKVLQRYHTVGFILYNFFILPFISIFKTKTLTNAPKHSKLLSLLYHSKSHFQTKTKNVPSKKH